jgi:hypothetical protein
MNDIKLDEARQEIIRLHNEIIGSTRRTVSDAIRIGQIISEQKEKLEHGDFLPWVGTLPFGNDITHKYMRLAQYSGKLTKCVNLQDAYKQIDSIESAEKRKEDERKQTLIRERIKTGKKPEGWDRSLDYEYDKRIKLGGYAKLRDDYKPPEKSKPKQERNAEFLSQAADIFLEQADKRDDFKNKIRLSDDGKREPFIDAIMDYLSELENDNRRIEACNNIIKVCRNICVKLQAKS